MLAHPLLLPMLMTLSLAGRFPSFMISTLQEHLTYGLGLQPFKTKIWISSMLRGQLAYLTALGSGLTICGQAFSDDKGLGIPSGDDTFVAQWLQGVAIVGRILTASVRQGLCCHCWSATSLSKGVLLLLSLQIWLSQHD